MSAWLEWFVQTISSAGVVAVLAIILKPFWEKGLQARFDRSLEDLKSTLRKDEDRLRAELRANQDNITALRSITSATMTARNTALEARRLEAIEGLWKATANHAQLKHAAAMMRAIDTNFALKVVETGTSDSLKIKQFAEILWNTFRLERLKDDGLGQVKSYEHRPFVSDKAWMIFETYTSVIMMPVMILASLKFGIGGNIIKPQTAAVSAAKQILPAHSAFLDKYGEQGLLHLIDDLELALLVQLKADLYDSSDTDPAALERALGMIRSTGLVSMSLPENVPAVTIPDIAGLKSDISSDN